MIFRAVLGCIGNKNMTGVMPRTAVVCPNELEHMFANTVRKSLSEIRPARTARCLLRKHSMLLMLW